MSTPEGNVKLKIKNYLNGLAPALWYFMPVNNGYGIKGVPDFVGCYYGRFFTIEAKPAGEKEKPWQTLLRTEKLIPAGAWSIVASEVTPVAAMLEHIEWLASVERGTRAI
jgi:hypothetical protein